MDPSKIELYPFISDKQERLSAGRRFAETAERLVDNIGRYLLVSILRVHEESDMGVKGGIDLRENAETTGTLGANNKADKENQMLADSWRTTENIALEELPCQIIDMMSPTSAGGLFHLNIESNEEFISTLSNVKWHNMKHVCTKCDLTERFVRFIMFLDLKELRADSHSSDWNPELE
uniref:Uncharacterized protein n=1 Tax=Magallana gigas TaxID=29159 RepID=K1QMU5_MAGGI